MKNIIKIFLAVLILTSCNFNKNDVTNLKCFQVINYQNIEPLPINEKQILQITKLETTKNSIISNIKKIIENDGLYYILDDKNVKIFIFDVKTGKFVNSLLKIGKGPGEYINIIDFCIRDSIIYALTFGGKINLYNRKNLRFIKSFKVPDKYVPINITVSDSFIFYTNFPRNNINTSVFKSTIDGKEFEIISTYPYNVNCDFTLRGNQNLFLKNNNHVYFRHNLENVLYINDSPNIKFDFGKYNIPQTTNFCDIESSIKNGEKIAIIQSYYINNEYFIFEFLINGVKTFWAIIDNSKIELDLFYGFEFTDLRRTFRPIAIDQEGLLFCIRGDDLIHLKDMRPTKFLTEENILITKAFIKNLNSQIKDNPNIIKVKI